MFIRRGAVTVILSFFYPVRIGRFSTGGKTKQG